MKENQVTERWAPAVYIRENGSILDFTGLYEVSDMGRVRSLNYNGLVGRVGVLSQATYENSGGDIYYIVVLRKEGKSYTLRTHRLVLSSFKESEYFSGAVCDHIVARSETSCDNRLTNLRWITQRQNCNTEHRSTLISKTQINHPAKSKRVRVTDLTTGKVTIYPSSREAGRALGLSPRSPSVYIYKRKGFYKKLNLHFAYV